MANVTATTFNLTGGAVKYGDSGSPTEIFTAIAQVESVDWSGDKWDAQDVTSADNTDRAKRYTRYLKDEGDFKCMFWLNPNDSTHQAVRTMATPSSGSTLTPTNWKYVRPAGLGEADFAAVLISCSEGKVELNKGTQCTLTLKISGP